MNGLFYRVKCKCGNEQVLFSHASREVKCAKCQKILSHPTGGKAVIDGEIIEELG